MNILLTNDDGISSEGILKLALALRSRGHRASVIAPDTDRSGVSHGLSVIQGPLKLAKAGDDAWSCSGKPADCVVLALLGALPAKPDLVISGINRGANLGTDIVYSGTAAAARQASIMGLPSLALSLAGSLAESVPFYWDMAASWAADRLDELLAFWREDYFVNVNIPNNPAGPDGLKTAWPAVKRYNDALKTIDGRDESRWCFIDFGGEFVVPEEGSDADAVRRNFASVSVVYDFPAVRKDLCPGAPDSVAVAPGSARGRGRG